MRPSVWTSALVELEPEEAAERLARIGWRCLELSDEHMRKVAGRELAGGAARALKELCGKLKVEVPQAHGPMFNCCEDDKLEEHLELTEEVLKLAGILGIRWVVLHPGSASVAEDDDALEYVRRRNLEVFRRLSDVAEEAGVGIALENMNDGERPGRRTFGSTPPELLWLVGNLGPGTGICWDTGHAHLQRLDQRRALRALGKHLVATHIADNDGSGDQHLFPFEGKVDWKGVMEGLKDVGYSGPFNLEVPGETKVPLPVREAKLRYGLELAEAMAEGKVP